MQTRVVTGGPHFPYLFLLVADVLQALINHDGSISHPLAPGRSCPIIQYADDTLLLIPAELGAVQTLKSLLDQFSAATGLKINYHKSTLVSMQVLKQSAASSKQFCSAKLTVSLRCIWGLMSSPICQHLLIDFKSR